MPLKPGSDKKTISTNIREFHTGKTYAHTAAKFGKEKANKQAVAVALSTARKYRKKADGGEVSDEDKREAINIRPVAPPISGAPEGYQPEPAQSTGPSGVLDYLTPGEDFRKSLQGYNESAYDLHQQALENMRSGNLGRAALGAGQQVLSAAMPAIAPIGALYDTASETVGHLAGPAAKAAADVAGWFTPGDAAKIAAAGVGFTAAGIKNVDKINKMVMKASELHQDYNTGAADLSKELKSQYPKDLAQSAFYMGLQPEDLANLKSYMTPGAWEAFDKHWNKLIKSPAAQKAAVKGQEAAKSADIIDFPAKEKPPEYQPPAGNFGHEISPGDTKWSVSGPQLGSNPGGKFKDPQTGNEYYIKVGQSKDHVRNENLAAALYDLAGVPTLKYHLDPHGDHIITGWEKLQKNNAYKLSPLEKDIAQRDFATHAWLANHDVVGSGGDNLGVNKAGNVIPLDLGGALEYRAKGKPKGENFGHVVDEIYNMRGLNPDIPAPDAKNIFGNMSDADVAESAKAVISIPDQKIIDTVKKFGGSDQLAGKLIIRKYGLAKWVEQHGGGGEPPPSAGRTEVPPPVGPEGWGEDVAYHDLGAPSTTMGKGEGFVNAFKKSLYKHFSDEGGAYKEVLPVQKDKDWINNWGYGDTLPVSKSSIIKGLAHQSFEDFLSKNKLSEYGGKVTHLKNELSKLTTQSFLKSMSYFHLKDNEIENIFSYLPESKIDDIKGYLSHELQNEGYAVSEGQLAKSPQLLAEKTIQQHLQPIDWHSYSPPEGNKLPLEGPGSGGIKWGQNTPWDLRKMGFNPENLIWKGGGWEGHYPEELPDVRKKFSEPAFFGAPNPEVAKAYGALGAPYIARAQKSYAVKWSDILKQLEPQAHIYEEGGAHYSGYTMNKLAKYGQKIGADIIAVHGIHDIGGQGSHTQYLVLKPEILRAPHAKMDPNKFHLRHPLAAITGIAGAGLYTYGTQKGEANEMNKGGKVKHPQIDEDPQDHEFINFKRGGLIDSDIPGRTDKIPMKVSAGAYVLPADIPSALGQGNSKAGAEILRKMFTHSAYGLPPPHIHGREFRYPHLLHMRFSKHAEGGKVEAEKVLPESHQLGMKVPKGGSMCANCKFLSSPTTCGNKGFIQWNGSDKLPEPADEYCCDLYGHKIEAKADGGATEHVPIIAAGGEFIIHPDVVKHIGNGSMKDGHKLLDKFVIHTRKEHIKTLRKLKPPK